MELIKKKISLSNYICRVNPYLVDGLIPDGIICTGLTSHWGEITGLTSDGDIEYYNSGNTTYNSNLCYFSILINQTIDDIGVLESEINDWIPNKTYYNGESVLENGYSYRCFIEQSNSNTFNLTDWELNTIAISTGSTVNFNGESKINEFRRYSKTDTDSDLYNSVFNSGFTQEIVNTYGNINKIISQSINYTGSKQNLYEYVLGATEGELNTTGIHYQDLNNGSSQISYIASGLTSDNSISAPNIKHDYLLGIIEPPQISIDVYIDRGVNSTFDKNLKLGDIRSMDALTNYGNGFFNIKTN